MIRFEANPTLKGYASMNELGLFTLALGLSKPWQVVDLKFSCPSCQETKEGEVHDTLDRTWR